MKSHLLLPLSVICGAIFESFAGPSSADYQAAIREATERYRGDCTEIIHTIVYEEASFQVEGMPDMRPVCLFGCNPFPYEPFLLMPESLRRATPNPSMQLTPSRTAFTFSHD